MGKQKFDAVFFATSFKASVRLVKDAKDQPMVIFQDNPGVCHALRSDRIQRALRSHAKPCEAMRSHAKPCEAMRSHAKTMDIRLSKPRIEEVIDELDAIAFEEGEIITSHYRVAPMLSGYLYHLGDGRFLQEADGKAIVTTTIPNGLYFTETSTMLAAPAPKLKFDPKSLLMWFNCSVREKLLLLAWLTNTVATPKAAQLPYPILVVRAPAGSGKTFMCGKVIRQLVDPCQVASQTMPKAVKDIAISAQNSHVLIYDNLRYLTKDLSDGLCQVATGGSTVGRKLYTDGQEFSMDLRCPLVLNGIHTFVTESDLVSRCINITLKPIREEDRCSEAELSSKFSEELPSLIYTLHVLAAKVLAVRDKVKVRYRSRMADFSVWVAALEAVLGQKSGALQQAYKQNVEQANVAGVVDDSLFVALTELAKRYRNASPWHGTPEALLRSLEVQTEVSRGALPRLASAMGKRIDQLNEALKSCGVHVVRGRATDRFYDVWFEPKTHELRDDRVGTANPPVTSTPPSPTLPVSGEVDAEELLR